MRAEVIAIGDELTTGQRLDTNSQWISRELGVLGIPVAFHTTICDGLEDGVAALRIAAARAELVVITGGLGPTADDLTRDVLALVSGQPLELDAASVAAVETRFARRGMPMPESNRRQALFPRSSRIIPNPEGTAPGIDINLSRDGGAGGSAAGGCRVFALPGVPAEMRLMWRLSVAPALVAMDPEQATIAFRRIKCFGAGESAVEAMLPDLIRRGRDPLVGITVHEATITLRIAARGRDEADCRARMAPTEAIIREILGDLVFGTEEDELEDATLAAVRAAEGTLATVEIGTHGLVAALMAHSLGRGSPGGFLGGTVLPSSGPSAQPQQLAELAQSCRKAWGSTHALAVGGAYPQEGREAVGIVLAGPQGVIAVEHVLGGGPELRLVRAAKTALNLVRLQIAATFPPPSSFSPVATPPTAPR